MKGKKEKKGFSQGSAVYQKMRTAAATILAAWDEATSWRPSECYNT